MTDHWIHEGEGFLSLFECREGGNSQRLRKKSSYLLSHRLRYSYKVTTRSFLDTITVRISSERGGEGIKESMNLDMKSRDDDAVTALFSASIWQGENRDPNLST